MAALIQFLFASPNVWAPILVILIGLLSRKTYRQGGTRAVKEKMLSWFFFLCIGYIGLWGGVCHVFFGDFTAKAIGWLPSPFQYEVGVANFAIAAMGFYAFKVKLYQARVAVMLGFAVWFLGDAAGHIYQLVGLHDKAAYNAGSTLYTDIILPLMGFLLLILCRPQAKNS